MSFARITLAEYSSSSMLVRKTISKRLKAYIRLT